MNTAAPYMISATMAEQVVEFNQKVLKVDLRQINLLSVAEFEISKKCLNEEIVEFEDAYKEGDLIKCVDAMIDEIYFAIGVLYKMGLTAESIDKVFAHVHSKNLEKKLGVNHNRGDGSAADAVKSAEWVGPEEGIAFILDNQG